MDYAPTIREVEGLPVVGVKATRLAGNIPSLHHYARALDAAGSSWQPAVEAGMARFSSGFAIVNNQPVFFVPGLQSDLLSGALLIGSNLDDPTFTQQDAFSFIRPNGGLVCRLEQIGTALFVLSLEDRLEVLRSDDGGPWQLVADLDGPAETYSAAKHVVAVIDGRLAMAYEFADAVWFRMALDSGAMLWNSPVLIRDAPASGNFGLVELAGRPAVALATKDSFTVDLVQAVDADGMAWGAPQVISDYGSAADCTLAEIEGQPAILFRNITTGLLEYARRRP